MTTISNLPEEILLEIFTRMPAKSVGRCRCLSKLWLANLSTTQFINLHLTRHQQEHLLLIFDYAGSLHTIAPPITDEAVSTELSGLPGNWKKVLGSCNGLVLLLNFENELFLVNPVMQQQVRVPPHPPLPLDLENKNIIKMFGFGYDISKDDYKILSLTTYFNPQSRSYDTLAHVYSLKMGVWKSKSIDTLAHVWVRPSGAVTAGAHVNGVIHWLSTVPCMTLSTFNLADEVFGVIPLPDDNRISRLLVASVLRGCLLLVGDVELNRELKACIMEEYGVHESWTNFRISIRGSSSIRIDPLCFTGENVVMMSHSLGGSLLLSNLGTQTMKSMVVNGAQPYFHDGRIFIESLVSPSSFTLIAEEKNDGTDFANNTLEAGPSQAPRGSSG